MLLISEVLVCFCFVMVANEGVLNTLKLELELKWKFSL